MRYNRILLKLSGGALSSGSKDTFDKDALEHITGQIISAGSAGVEVAVLVGGGNIFRGRTADEWGIERAEADNIGMLATIINSLILRGALMHKTDRDVRVMTSIPINSVAEPYIRLKAIKHLENGAIVILGGGIGQPFVTTDYPSVQRAIEIRADVVLMAKSGTNGVYTGDPNTDPSAKRYKSLSSADTVSKDIQVADSSAFILANEYAMPIYVFDFMEDNSIVRVCAGENIGTYIGRDCQTQLY